MDPGALPWARTGGVVGIVGHVYGRSLRERRSRLLARGRGSAKLAPSMNRRDVLLLVASTAVLGFGVARIVSAPGPATRQVSIEAAIIGSAPIARNASLVQEASWTPPDDAFIIGWSPSVGAPDALPELHLKSGRTTIFSVIPSSVDAFRPTFLPAGSGFLVRKGEPVTLQLAVHNSGADGETRGARALIYFYPVAWR